MKTAAIISVASFVLSIVVLLVVMDLGGIEPLEILLIIGIFLVVFFVFIYPMIVKPALLQSRLKKTGKKATAKIIKIQDTGTTVNDNPQVKLTVEVTPEYGTPYTTVFKQVISRLEVHLFKPGVLLNVLVDPKDREKIILDTFGESKSGEDVNTVPAGPWAGVSRDEVQRRLKDLDEKNKKILSNGISARAIVKKYTFLGVNVNGENPLAELELEVLPDDKPAFSVVVQGVISVSSVDKYQPGEEIFIKYDSYNFKKVAIDHS
ncbi:MAG: hypothetical protein JW917_00750 [Ignavibacteria bacterium]|nr:hypothetical protein [Ignavibacteria bacterium]